MTNTKDEQHFRQLLTQQRARVIEDLQKHGRIPKERVDAEDNDLTDQANVAVARDLDQQLAISEDHLLEKIDLALVRLDNGSYGKCAQCGVEIPKERLEAKPSVSLCSPCQSKKEASHVN